MAWYAATSIGELRGINEQIASACSDKKATRREQGRKTYGRNEYEGWERDDRVVVHMDINSGADFDALTLFT